MINLLQEFKGFKILPEASFDEIIVEKSEGFLDLQFRIDGLTYTLKFDYFFDYSMHEDNDGFRTYDSGFELYNIHDFAYSDDEIEVEVELTSEEEAFIVDCVSYSVLGYKMDEYLSENS